MNYAKKDQQRPGKANVRSKISIPFKSRRQAAFAEGKLIAPSTLESECSTLVDFSDDYLAPDPDTGDFEDEINDDVLLDADNSAWRRGERTQAPRCRAVHPSGNPKYSANHAQMLDDDDMSWNMPKSTKVSIPTRILHALAGQ